MFTILFLRFLFSFCFDWEDISNTRDSAWTHFQTTRCSSKVLRCTSYFQLFSRSLEMWLNAVFSVWYNTLKRSLKQIKVKVNQITQESLATFRTLSRLANSFLSNSPNGSRHNKCYSAYKSTIKSILFDTVHLSIDCLFQDSSVR